MESEFEIIERFKKNVPVDVSALAEALGLTVWEDDELPSDVSGKLCKDIEQGGPSGYSVIIRASDPYVRKRFTLAHEIAHFVLHRKRMIGSSLTDDEYYRSKSLSSWDEVEANRLAADILMPRKILVEKIKELGEDPVVLARLFEVSEASMRIRLGIKAAA